MLECVSKIDNSDIITVRRLSDTVGGVYLFIVGQLETDSSKGTISCRVWDCLQLWAVKTPDTFLRDWPDRASLFFWKIKKMKAFFLKAILSYLLYNLLYIYFGGVKKSVLSRVCDEISDKKIRDTWQKNTKLLEVCHALLFEKSTWYNKIAIGKPIATCRSWEEVIVVSYLFELFLNVMANVLAHFICKWLDDEDKR